MDARGWTRQRGSAFVRSFVRSLARSLVRSFVRSGGSVMVAGFMGVLDGIGAVVVFGERDKDAVESTERWRG